MGKPIAANPVGKPLDVPVFGLVVTVEVGQEGYFDRFTFCDYFKNYVRLSSIPVSVLCV